MKRAGPNIFSSVGILTLISGLHIEAADRAPAATQSVAKQSPARSSLETKLDNERLAKDWGLRSEEWARYLELMQGPLGVYSPHLDPLTALGIEARSDEERRHYAELQVRMEGRRVEKILAYQRAYDQAWKHLHPTLKPVNLASTSRIERRSEAAAVEPRRMAVFVKDDCMPCDQRVRQLQAAGAAFDVYMVGSRNDDALIRRWANRAGIDPAKVRSGVITLNHDSGRWLSIGGQGELPATMRESNGRWQRE